MSKVNDTHCSVQTFQFKVKKYFQKAALYLLPLEDNQVVLQYIPWHPGIPSFHCKRMNISVHRMCPRIWGLQHLVLWWRLSCSQSPHRVPDSHQDLLKSIPGFCHSICRWWHLDTQLEHKRKTQCIHYLCAGRLYSYRLWHSHGIPSGFCFCMTKYNRPC